MHAYQQPEFAMHADVQASVWDVQRSMPQLVAPNAPVTSEAQASSKASFTMHRLQLLMAQDLLRAATAEDFEDTLRAALCDVDDWAELPSSPMESVETLCHVLGEPATQGIIDAALLLRPHPAPSSHVKRIWMPLLESAAIPPKVRIRLCHMLCVLPAFSAIHLAARRGKPVPAHIAASIAHTIARGVAAINELNAVI